MFFTYHFLCVLRVPLQDLHPLGEGLKETLGLRMWLALFGKEGWPRVLVLVTMNNGCLSPVSLCWEEMATTSSIPDWPAQDFGSGFWFRFLGFDFRGFNLLFYASLHFWLVGSRNAIYSVLLFHVGSKGNPGNGWELGNNPWWALLHSQRSLHTNELFILQAFVTFPSPFPRSKALKRSWVWSFMKSEQRVAKILST